MGKPRMIILIRHAQSEGNKNREIHQHVPDHRVKLTSEGLQQAEEAGRRLRHLLKPNDTIRFYTSPYRRTRETTEGILSTLTSNDPTPTPFPRDSIKVYEEPRLREQDFGNFQPCSAEMERMWQERADYGHFFYRIPNGESAADAYDRVSGFNESLWRSIGEDDFPSVCILVTHGLMTRVFLMKWYHWSVEHFEDLRNVNHCEFIIMNKNPESGKFYLEKELRTWSELKQRAAAMDAANADSNGNVARSMSQNAQSPVLRRWGGCAFGCDHDKINFPRRVRRRDTSDIMNGNGNATKSSENTSQPHSWDAKMSCQSYHSYSHTSENGSLLVNEEPSAPPKTPKQKHDSIKYNHNQMQNSIPEESTGLAYAQPAFTSIQNGLSEQKDRSRSHDEHKSSYLYVDGSNDNGNYLGASPGALQLGRDGGGTLSGAASPTGIKSEEDDYFVSTLSFAQTSATSASSLPQHSPSFSSNSLLPPPTATAVTRHQLQQQYEQHEQQQQQRQTQDQSSSTEHPSSSPSAAVAIAPSSTPSHHLPSPSSSSSSPYQANPENWTSRSGMGAGAHAEPLGDYGDAADGVSKMKESGERGGKVIDDTGQMGNIDGGGGRGGGGRHFEAVQRAEERLNSVGESVY